MNIDNRSAEQKMTDLSPWRHEIELGPSSYSMMENTFKNSFTMYDINADLDIYSKRAALKSSEAVVSIVSYLDEKMIFCASGIIIECNGDSDGMFDAILLSTASLLKFGDKGTSADNIKILVHFWGGKSYTGEILGYDLHYNIIAVRVRLETAITVPILRDVDDSMPIISNGPHDSGKSTGSILHRHSNKFNLVPGVKLVAVGRYHMSHYKLMVAPAIFSADCCRLDCKELFRANCKISMCGIGGPLLNLDGEVIGINFFGDLCTPFLPINVASRWEFRRPWLGMEATNLYCGRVDVLEHIIRKFPNISKGVIVEEVAHGSPADIAGIKTNDVIIRCNGKKVKSFLGLFKRIYDKIGQEIEVRLIRPFDGDLLNLAIVVGEPVKVNSWPLPRAKLGREGGKDRLLGHRVDFILFLVQFVKI